MKYFVPIILLVLNFFPVFSQLPVYKNPDMPVETRVNDLLGRMTPEEKFWQLFMVPGDLSIGREKLKTGIFGFQVSAKGATGDAAGHMLTYGPSGTGRATAEKINEMQKFFLEESRLGIPIIPFDEALHGLIRDNATAFPQSIALAATFDRDLMRWVANAIAMETKTRGIRQILSPVINIARDVRWGRTEETYGEDPYLTSQMGLAFMSEYEKLGVIATPKHFAVNAGDGGRDSYPIHYDERLLDEIYFPAFIAAVQQAGARSVMTSYNSLNGSPCSANNWLLNEKLKKEWGFRGFVISDACAVGGANVLHYTTSTYAESAKASIESGLDVIFQTDYNHAPLFYEAFEKDKIAPSKIDSAVARVLRVKFELGLFENPYVDPELAEKTNGSAEHRRIALQAARESIVLLKNENNILPLNKSIRRLAVIGTDAAEARLGGYSGPGINKVSILDGIRSMAPADVKIVYSPGCGRTAPTYETIPSDCLFTANDNDKTNGLKAEYFDNTQIHGNAKVNRIDKDINFGWTLYGPDPSLSFDWYSARWTGILKPEVSGTFNIGIEGNDGYRLYIDNKLLIDNWVKKSFGTKLAGFTFEKGKTYDFRLEYFESTGNARLRLVWDAGMKDTITQSISDAVSTAKLCDAAVVVVGIHEGEFQDRAILSLPGRQEELIQAIAATGKPVIVLLVGGSAITMNPWIDKVKGIIDGWYPGEVGGTAVAEVLFGKYNPAGRLPITFPVSEGQLPLVYNHKPTGRGDDYYDLTGQPLFPFGYGLSYTTFVYSDLKFNKSVIKPDEAVEVRFKVTNTGEITGDEVCQLYIRDELASVARPITELKQFDRISLQPNETKEIVFDLTPETLSMLDINMKKVVEPGDFRIMIGSSSKDIRLRGILTVSSN